MFSKNEAAQLKKEFWTAFGKSFPRKWLLYNTKIKDFSFKFFADHNSAAVYLDLEMEDDTLRTAYWEKMESLSSIIQQAVPNAEFLSETTLENGKTIDRIEVKMDHVSIYNKATWRDIFEFFVENMTAMETVFYEYEDYIKDV